MRRFLTLLGLLVLVGAVAINWAGATSTSSHRPIGSDLNLEGPESYVAYVDSIWESSSYPLGAAAYTTVGAPTGYSIQFFEIWSTKLVGVASASELFTVRPWASSTDSTSLNKGTAGAISVRLHSEAAPIQFPLKAYKYSLTSIGTSDSVRARAYLKKN